MGKSKLESIEHELREFTVVDDMIFLDEDEFNKYLNTCDAEYLASNFIPDVDSMIKEWGTSEDEMLQCYDYDEEALDKAADEYEDYVYNLSSKYDVHYYNKHNGMYLLCGKYGNLKKFAEEYDCHIDMSNPGEALYDCAEECNIDLESGDDSFILGKLSQSKHRMSEAFNLRKFRNQRKRLVK